MPESNPVRFLNELDDALLTSRLFPSDHPDAEESRDRLAAACAMFAEDVEHAISFSLDHVSWNGQRLPVPAPGAGRGPLSLLLQFGFTDLRLTFPRATQGLARLIGELSALSARPLDDQPTHLAAVLQSLPGVEIGSAVMPNTAARPDPGPRMDDDASALPTAPDHAAEFEWVEADVLDFEWTDREVSAELAASLSEKAVRPHLMRILGEVLTLRPTEAAAEAAAQRLAEEFVSAIDLGDLEEAHRSAPLIAASPAASARQFAIEEGVRAAARAFPALDSELHQSLVGVIGALGTAAIPHLLEAVADERNTVARRRLLEAVLRFGDGATDFIRPLLADDQWFVVRNAVFLLRRLGDQDVAPRLKERLEDAKPQLAAEIFKSLVALEDPDWRPILLREICNSNNERARAAIEVAAQIKHRDIVAAIITRLEELFGQRLRETISLDLLRALGRLGDPAALPLLTKIVSLRQWRFRFSLTPVRREAAAAIARIATPEARALAARLAADGDAEVAAAARDPEVGDAARLAPSFRKRLVTWDEALESVIAELVSGAVILALNGLDDPLSRRSVGRLLDYLNSAFDQEPQVVFLLIGEELFIPERPVLRRIRQTGPLIRWFRRRGIESVNFMSDVTPDELRIFMDDLAATHDKPVASHPHIQVSSVDLLATGTTAGPGNVAGRGFFRRRARVRHLAQVLSDFSMGASFRTGDLQDVVTSIMRALERNGDPLAHLAPWSGDELWNAVHGHNVALIASGLGRLAGLGPPLCTELAMAGLVHDIGKLFVAADSVESDPDLGDAEIEVLRDHPLVGLQQLLPHTDLPAVALFAAYEHRLNHDGTGFPVLTAQRRPHPATALVSLADAFDVWITRRGRLGGKVRDRSLAWIEANSGTLFDPRWADALCRLARTSPAVRHL